MIANESLAGWLGDKAAQARSLSLSDDIGRGLRAHPALVRLEEGLAAAEGISSDSDA